MKSTTCRFGDDTVLIVPVICDIIALSVSSRALSSFCSRFCSWVCAVFVDAGVCLGDGGLRRKTVNTAVCDIALHFWIQLVGYAVLLFLEQMMYG